jgi:SAM-dependent methyltransferase
MEGTQRTRRLAELVKKEAFYWGNSVADAYHKAAAADMDSHWERHIWPMLSRYPIDFSRTMDFACGYGRNARKLREVGAKLVTLVDVHSENVAYCEDNLVPLGGFDVFQNTGYDLMGIQSGAYTHIYSFDSMVHFDLEIVLSYIAEFARVLQPGGTAFVHHSNCTARPGASFRDNPHWRNFMSDAIFRHASIRNGFQILDQQRLSWAGEDIDCVTLMRLPF